jgi:predicted glycosyltransferase
MKNVIFLVKNGIGYGHIRRAILLAQALRGRPGLRPIIISQAHTLHLFAGAGIPVVNFPLLQRLPTDVSEDCYTDILDALLAKLDPAVIVEDTYPDQRYARLESVRGVPRILLMRRLDGLSLDQLRTRGTLAQYDEILIAQTPDEFALEGHSGQTRAMVESTNRFCFVGTIHHTPSTDDIRRAREIFAPGPEPLVVVSAGAGGDQLSDGFGDRLFGSCADLAARLLDEHHPARFVLVTGPYYAGRPLAATANTTVLQFEPTLPALLASADVAVVKPGHNVLCETLTGSANLVLVPDASFMEGVEEHAARTVATYGGRVIAPDHDEIARAVRAALTDERRTRRPRANHDGIAAVTAVIEHYAHSTSLTHIEARTLTVIVETDGGEFRLLGPDDTLHPASLIRMSAIQLDTIPSTSGVVADADLPHHLDVQDLVDHGVRMLLTPGNNPRPAMVRSLTTTPPSVLPLPIPVDVLRPRRGDLRNTTRRIRAALEENLSAVILLDLRGVSETESQAHPRDIRAWVATQPIRLTGLDTPRKHAADHLMRSAASA